jgi:regulator of cell morphogenesis and NO signaling
MAPLTSTHQQGHKARTLACEEEAMNMTTGKTVRELALEKPGAARVFEKLGIDYCCGGKQTLEQACHSASIAVDDVLVALGVADHSGQALAKDSDWQKEPLGDLIFHIRTTHHQYTREAIARLGPLFDKVCSVHGERHPELFELRAIFQGLAQELTTHLMKEEMVLFPYVERMEESVLQNEPILPAPFGTVQNPVSMMEHEHDSAGNALRALRASSDDYTAPPDGCVSFQTLYKTLAELEVDLHQHIHLENNILFPRAIALENAH